MDRFIEPGYYFAIIEHNNLKSNMDRFIVHCVIISTLRQDEFKIQYG